MAVLITTKPQHPSFGYQRPTLQTVLILMLAMMACVDPLACPHSWNPILKLGQDETAW